MLGTSTASRTELLAAVEQIRPIVESSRDEGEENRRLPDAVVAALREASLLDLWVPREYGGREVDLPLFMEVTESLARIDSAAGWVFSTGAAGALMTAFLPQDTARQAFAGGTNVMLPGASQPKGRAVPVPGGYRVTGRWPLASGADHGAWLGIVSMVFDGDTPRLNQHGAPDFKAMALPREECEVLDVWHSLGMRGTGSTDFVVKESFVPEDRTFSVFTAPPQVQGALYQLGVLRLFAMSVSSVLPGIARSAIDAFIEMAREKTPSFSQTSLAARPTIHAELARVEALLQSARSYLYEVAEEMMAAVSAGEPISDELEAQRRLACSNVGAACTGVVDRLFALSGSTVIYSGTKLERSLRDIHTAAQHLFVSPIWWERTGQFYFGLGLGMP
jgi:alkylation response protein AidB-like acyl-CoA dehydrogenase